MTLALMVVSVTVQSAPGIETIQQSPATKRIGLDAHYVDLRVASFGDDVAISREWIDGKWVWNKQWQDVTSQKSQTNGGGGSGEGTGMVMPDPVFWFQGHDEIERYKAQFERVSGDGTTYVFRGGNEIPGEYFELTQHSLTWRDNSGNWIRYTPENPEQMDFYGGPAMAGHIHSYGTELYTNTFTLDDQKRIKELRDNFGNLLLTFEYLDSTDLPVRIEDYSGRVVSYTYNSDNQLTGVTDVRGQTWTYTYTENGKPATVTDPNNNQTQYVYSQNSVTVVTADQLETKYTYRYDKAEDRFYRTVLEPDGSVRESMYNNGGVIESEPRYQLQVNGEVVSQRFGTESQPRYVNAAGEATAHEKNHLGKTTQISHPDGTKEVWEYSADGRYLKAYINQRGIRTEWDYDAKGRVTEERRAAGLPVQQTIRYTYPDLLTRITTHVGDAYTGDAITTEKLDQYGNVSQFTDAESNTSKYTHNVLGQVLTETLPSGSVYTYEYDSAGNLTKVIDPLNRVTGYTYDAAGNLASVTWPNQAVTSYAYNVLNQQVSVTNALNQTTEMVYDRTTRAFTVKDARNAATTLRMNARGLPAVIKDPNGNVTQQTYDDGRLVSTQYPTFEQSYDYGAGSRLKRVTEHYDGQQSATQLQVNPLGQVEQQIDANQNPEYREYDGLGRLTQITDAIGGITRLTYDVHGNLVQVTDPENRSTWFEYGRNGNVVAEERRPNAGEISRRSYQYDADGNLHIEITPNGEKAVYDYNAAGELALITLYPDRTTSTPEQVISLTYNALGKLTSYDDGETSGSYTYDDVGQLLTATTDYGSFAKSISYTYDAAGNIASYTNPENVTYTYSYDANGQVTSINIPGVGVVGFTDYQWNQPTRITLPGGSEIQRQYDGLQRMKTNTLLDPAQSALMSVMYGYDAVGNIRSKTSQAGDALYDYDSLYRLTSADYPAANDETFDYDGVGNRTSFNGDTSWQYNNANQLTGQNDAVYEYNANGHLIQKTENGNVTKYFYNSRERLVRVESGSGDVIARYGFNPFGHRLWKEVGGERTYFFYSPSGLVAEYDESGSLAKEYHYMPNSPWMTNPLMQRSNGQLYFYQNDKVGAPQRLLKMSGEVVWEASYLVFGEVDLNEVDVSNNLRFPGQYYDYETGFYHNYFRDYDPELGRYIQSDPAGLIGGRNTYSYVYNNPLLYFDPYGLWAWGDPLPQGLVDFSAGFGDTISFGATDWVRDQMGTNGVVDKCSGAYGGGELAGIAYGFAAGGALGWRAAGSKAVGKEFSHWIPARAKKWPAFNSPFGRWLLKKGNKWDGNYVSPTRHYRHDNFRYPRGWRDLGPRFPGWVQQLDRIPNVYKGAGVGSGATAASASGDDCECN